MSDVADCKDRCNRVQGSPVHEPGWRGDGRGGTSVLRSLNAAAILRTLYREGACSRARLSRLTGMSPATVSRITAEMIRSSLVVETSRGESTGGRRPVLLRIDAGQLFAVGIQVQRDRIACLLTDLRGTPLARRVDSPFDLEPEGMLAQLARCVEGTVRQASVERQRVLGVGVGIAGVVDGARGLVVRSVNLGWRDVPLAVRLQELLGLPVLLENDANAAAMAEHWLGPSDQGGDLMFLKTEAGVGAGILLGGRLASGPRGMAGEIGHLTVVPGGHPCRCGGAGCLETYVNVQDVLGRYQRATGTPIDRDAFFARWREGRDPVAASLVQEAAAALGTVASAAAMLLDLDQVIIGGIWGELGPDFLGNVAAEAWAAASRTGLPREIRIRGPHLGDDAELLGVIGCVVDRWLGPPSPGLTPWPPAGVVPAAGGAVWMRRRGAAAGASSPAALAVSAPERGEQGPGG